MINMMYAETKRLFKSKGFWITILIYLITLIISVYFQSQSQISGTFGDNGFVKDAGILLVVDHKITTLNEMVQLLGLNCGLVIFGIYFTIFICDEYNSGYIKNMVILPHGRYIVPLSKTWVATLYAFIFILCNYSFSMILGNLFFGEFILGNINELLMVALAMYLITFALMSLISFISTLTHNKLFGAIIVFLIVAGFMVGIIYPMFSLFTANNLTEFFISYFLSNTITSSSDLYYRMIIMSLIYALIYNILSVISLIKQEI